MVKREFTVEDFMAQMDQLRNLGSMKSIMDMIPCMSHIDAEAMERQLDQMQAVYCSMTRKERLTPELLEGSRHGRIARGAGVNLSDVAQFIKQFHSIRDAMKAIGGHVRRNKEGPYGGSFWKGPF